MTLDTSNAASADAVEVAVADIDEVLTVGFRYIESGSTLLMQRALGEPDPQDIVLGHDTYCLIVDEIGVHYGGVVDWSLRQDGLRLELDADAASALSLPRVVVISIPHGANLPSLEVAMRRVLDGEAAAP